jgi:hypothetical protein
VSAVLPEMSEDDPDYLLKQAERCRTVAKTATDEKMRQALLDMARDYEGRAHSVQAKKSGFQ